MSSWTNIRTKNILGPSLSKTFQSFVNGPDIDGVNCELNQLSKILNLDLSPFLLVNYFGMWDESDFPEDQKKELIAKQKEEDERWNDLSDFLILIDKILIAFKDYKVDEKQLNYSYEWWKGYFRFPVANKNYDSLALDLKIIKKFLIDSKNKGENKMAFYSE